MQADANSTRQDNSYAIHSPGTRAWIGIGVANAFIMFMGAPLSGVLGVDTCIGLCLGQLMVLTFWMLCGRETLASRLQLGMLLSITTLVVCAGRIGFGWMNLVSLSIGLGSIVSLGIAIPLAVMKSRGWELTASDVGDEVKPQLSIRWIMGFTLLIAVFATLHRGIAEAGLNNSLDGIQTLPAAVVMVVNLVTYAFVCFGIISLIWALLARRHLLTLVVKAVLFSLLAFFPFTSKTGSPAHLQYLGLIGPAFLCVTLSILCLRQSGLRMLNVQSRLQD